MARKRKGKECRDVVYITVGDVTITVSALGGKRLLAHGPRKAKIVGIHEMGKRLTKGTERG